MLRHFLAPVVDGKPTAGLFDGLQIADERLYPGMMLLQGKSQVIYLSLKTCEAKTHQAFLNELSELIKALYAQYTEVLADDGPLNSYVLCDN